MRKRFVDDISTCESLTSDNQHSYTTVTCHEDFLVALQLLGFGLYLISF